MILPDLKSLKDAPEHILSFDMTQHKETMRTVCSSHTLTRIKDYMNVYSMTRAGTQLQSSSKKTLASSSSKRIIKTVPLSRAARTDNTLTLNQETTDRVNPGEDKKKQAERLTKLITTANYAIANIKSDRLELQRDLATYECEFARSEGLGMKLIKLNSLASSLPDIFETLEVLSNTELTLLKNLQEGLQQVSVDQQPPGKETPSLPPSENYGSRTVSTKLIISYFKGVHVISGLHCLVNVVGDSLARSFRVTVQTMSGEEYMMTVDHKVKFDLNNLINVTKQQLLPHFYFTYTSKEFSLNFDTRCYTSFVTVVAEVQGSPEYLSTVILTQDDEEVRLTLMSPPAEITVPLSSITEKPSVFEMPLSRLTRLIKKSLHYLPSTHRLKWNTGKIVNVYKHKDKSSNFMDANYVKEMLEANYSLLHSGTLYLNGVPFTIEVVVYQDKDKLRIGSPHKYIDLPANSAELVMMSSLQFNNLRRSFLTLLKSLELAHLIHKLFPQYFVTA